MNKFGFFRVAVASPELKVADVNFNLECIKETIDLLIVKGVQLIGFPELCITGYSCGDLFYQQTLIRESWKALEEIVDFTAGKPISVVVGLPVVFSSKLFNCVALVASGKIVGVVPKTYLPTTKEYYEQRWFVSGKHIQNQEIVFFDKSIPFGTDLIFFANNCDNFILGLEVCEDLWSLQPPSVALAQEGATIIINSSASNELVSKHIYRRDLVKQQSAKCLVAYLYAGAGPGESTTDTVYGGHSLIAENGSILSETDRFCFETQVAISDIDLQQLNNERLTNSSYAFGSVTNCFRKLPFELPLLDESSASSSLLYRVIDCHPFVPNERSKYEGSCHEILEIQTTGLAKRLRETNIKNVVIGISGGLDSTLALLVAFNAFTKLNLSKTGIIAVTMPGFGSSKRTKNNADILIKKLGVTYRCINIENAVLQHFMDIGHNKNQYDVTYENSQARERTQILMDIANQTGGLVVGTGDLSELALGWCTYNGDHMSMYNVNAGVPKTLVKALIEWAAKELFDGDVFGVLKDICSTPISPELLPLDKESEIQQKTEDIIGPYELHDFFLFYFIRHHFSKEKILYLAAYAFRGKYSANELRKWIQVFYKRFFSQQYKRSAMPDGPKVGSVSLSPRGDWRMPSDISPDLWLK